MNAFVTIGQIRAIAEQIAPHCDGDDILLQDTLEGETDIIWLLSRLHEQIARDGEILVGIKDRQAALAERKSRIESRIDKFKEQVGTILRAAQLSKVELPEVTYSVRDGKPKLVVVDPDAVPAELTRTKAEPDKTAINEAYANADALPNWLVREPARDVVTGRVK